MNKERKKREEKILIGYLAEVFLFMISGAVFMFGIFNEWFFLIGILIAASGIYLSIKVGGLIALNAVLNMRYQKK